MLWGIFCCGNVGSHVSTLFCRGLLCKLSWHMLMTAIISASIQDFADILSICFSSMPLTRPKHLLLPSSLYITFIPNPKHTQIVILLLPTVTPHIIPHLLRLFRPKSFQSPLNLLIQPSKSRQNTLLHLSYKTKNYLPVNRTLLTRLLSQPRP